MPQEEDVVPEKEEEPDITEEEKNEILVNIVRSATFGREDFWAQRHLSAKCVVAHFSQLFFYYFKKIL